MAENPDKAHEMADARIAAGIAWLNKVRPDWKIDLETFDFLCCVNCILGQVFSDDRFDYPEDDPKRDADGYSLSLLEMDEVQLLGFGNCSDLPIEEPYEFMHDKWVEALQETLSQGKV
jgi:hypothetical protein